MTYVVFVLCFEWIDIGRSIGGVVNESTSVTKPTTLYTHLLQQRCSIRIVTMKKERKVGQGATTERKKSCRYHHHLLLYRRRHSHLFVVVVGCGAGGSKFHYHRDEIR